jgi:uncharacterized protein (TIGR03435 family)
MVQSMLEARFGLILRRERRTMDHSVLVIARIDAPLHAGLSKCEDPQSPPAPRPLRLPRGSVPLTGVCREISDIAANVANTLGVPVLDRTGLNGLWNFQLVFLHPESVTAGAAQASQDVPLLPIALQEQLGLKLERSQGPVDVLVVASVRTPTEN